MLKGIPAAISPQLLKVLAEMGHGDRIVIGDAYFASASLSRGHELVRADGMDAFVMTDAILQLMPLDRQAEDAVIAMGIPDRSGAAQPTPTAERFRTVIAKYEPQAAQAMRCVDRFAFYELTRNAYAVLATGDGLTNGCIILQKGVR